jgi:hypothetical protein
MAAALAIPGAPALATTGASAFATTGAPALATPDLIFIQFHQGLYLMKQNFHFHIDIDIRRWLVSGF